MSNDKANRFCNILPKPNNTTVKGKKSTVNNLHIAGSLEDFLM